jgi:UDP-glucose 4-epimerase
MVKKSNWNMKNKKLLILGGTGALGKTLIKRYQDKNTIIVFSRDEHKHVYMQKDPTFNPNKIQYTIGDVKDKTSIKNAIEDFKPDVIINTAALKHVPICENNAFESVNVNIIGHQNLIEAVKQSNHKIETLIFVSTDKACKPINVYGMCKAISEKLYIDYALKQKDIKVCLVRYGNVLESTGSVIPFFKKLLKENSPTLPITHMGMTRFLLTLQQATDLIDWTYKSPDSHGKIAIPKVKSFLITDIAKSLIKYYDLEDKVNLITVGIRPGEKIHEEMISPEEWLRTEEKENYLINSDNQYFAPGEFVLNNKKDKELYSYNSKDSLMDFNEAYKFLIDTKVLREE